MRYIKHLGSSYPPNRLSRLSRAIKHNDSLLRRSAAWALGRFGSEAGLAVRDLMHAFTDADAGVRQNVVVALGGIGPAAAPAVHYLKNALNEGDIELRRRAAWALGSIGPGARAAISSLKDARMQDDPQLRREAYFALVHIVPPEQFIDILVEVIKSKDEVLEEAFSFVGRRVAGLAYDPARVLAQRAIEAMNSPDDDVRTVGAGSILLASLALQRKMETLSTAELEQIITALEQAREFEGFKQVENSILEGPWKALNSELKSRQSQLVNRMYMLITENKWRSGIAIVLIFVLSVTLLMLGLCPLWLLRINETLKPYTDFTLPDWLGGMKLPIRAVLIVGFFHYHRRVLDAWVAAHIDSVRDRFAKRRTVDARKVHISVPVVVDGNTVADFSGESLKSSFVKQRTCLLIWGEGGSGKTSLACQVARWVMSEDAHQRPCGKHRMLPVLIEQDLRGETFLEAVRGQLQDLVDEPESIPVGLLEQLLRHRRILVIVDHFSEMSETTRMAFRPELPPFPVNALVVTSRIEALHQVDRITIKPCRIEEFTALSSFMESYLMRLGKRDLYSQSEFFYACARFSAMVGVRGITILLAKLYAEHMIAIKENADASEPRNVPELMLSYLNELNVNVAKNKLDDRTVHRDAKVVAWECLRQTFRPTSARLADTLAALGGDNAQARLEYIEDRLRLIQTIQPSQNQIRFLLDPLAEYLAAMHIVEDHDGIELRWREFLGQTNSKPEGTGTIASFLLAVQDCCLARRDETNIPTFVYQELAKACHQQA